MSGAITGREEDVAQMMAAWGEIAAYWTDKVAARRAQPLDPEADFVSHLCRSELDGAPLPDADVIDLMVTLTLGSLDTLKSQLGWCFYHLATHPEDRRRLVAEPGLIPGAVEEFLRAYPIVPMARKVTRDVDFHGCPMRKGDMVMLTYPSATRDPAPVPRRGQGDPRQVPEPAHRVRRQRAPLPRAPTSPAPRCRPRSGSGTISFPTTG